MPVVRAARIRGRRSRTFGAEGNAVRLSEVKIGLLLPTTGVDSAQGSDTTKGLELYLGRIGYSAGGREIKVLKKDDEAKPDLALTQLRNLIEGDGVDFAVGPISSAVALAIRNYVHEQGTPRSWNSVSG